jgi:hypothetical protein
MSDRDRGQVEASAAEVHDVVRCLRCSAGSPRQSRRRPASSRARPSSTSRAVPGAHPEPFASGRLAGWSGSMSIRPCSRWLVVMAVTSSSRKGGQARSAIGCQRVRCGDLPVRHHVVCGSGEGTRRAGQGGSPRSGGGLGFHRAVRWLPHHAGAVQRRTRCGRGRVAGRPLRHGEARSAGSPVRLSRGGGRLLPKHSGHRPVRIDRHLGHNRGFADGPSAAQPVTRDSPLSSMRLASASAPSPPPTAACSA